MRKIIVILSLIGITYMSYGKDVISIPDECRGNGCGSGWNEPLVPERIGLFGVDFDKACEQHDICYSRCLESCKEKDGTDKCDDTPFKVTERKLSCDNTFEESMEKTCISKTYWKKTACSATALGYSIVVRVAGGGSFHGKEVEQLLQYLSTEEGRIFNAKRFENDMLAITKQKGFTSNQKIRITIDGGKVKAFIGERPRVIPREQGLVLDKTDLLYGEYFNLTNMKLNSKPVDIKKLDFNKMDIEKLQQVTTFRK